MDYSILLFIFIFIFIFVVLFKIFGKNQDLNEKTLYKLAYDYLYGRNIDKDLSRGIECLKKSAALGYSKAQNDLGAFYENGKYINKDYKQAFYWYNKAVK